MGAATTELVPVTRRGGGIPIAQMRSVYRCDDVERRLTKLPPKEHESLRATYERMLEKGPERFQVKPSGLPVMDHLYDELPNFADVLDDVQAPARAVRGQPRRARDHAAAAARPARRRQDALRARAVACCSAPAWASCR